MVGHSIICDAERIVQMTMNKHSSNPLDGPMYTYHFIMIHKHGTLFIVQFPSDNSSTSQSTQRQPTTLPVSVKLSNKSKNLSGYQ